LIPAACCALISPLQSKEEKTCADLNDPAPLANLQGQAAGRGYRQRAFKDMAMLPQ